MNDIPSELASQTTMIEQARVVAEVKAMVIVAQERPRRLDRSRQMLHEACAVLEVADNAFYEFPQGNTLVRGPSVVLARELARCWGNVKHGITELARDDEAGKSQMMAYAWDLEGNYQAESKWVVPHRMDRNEGGPRILTGVNEIYNNNANQGGRRLREAILAILPPFFIEEGKDRCRQTITVGDGKPIEERRAAAVDLFEQIGVPLALIEQKLAKPVDNWNPYDLSQLRTSYASINRGEIDPDQEFPARRVTATEITEATAGAVTAKEIIEASGTTTAEAVAALAATGAEPWDNDPRPAQTAPEAPTEPESTDGPEARRALREATLRATAATKRVKLGDLIKAAKAELGVSYRNVADLSGDEDHTQIMLDWLDSQGSEAETE